MNVLLPPAQERPGVPFPGLSLFDQQGYAKHKITALQRQPVST